MSMGLGPLAAVMQARLWKYLTNRNLVDTSQSTVSSFLGDGEMEEPEEIAAIAVAGREKREDLMTVENSNLQRQEVTRSGQLKRQNKFKGAWKGGGWSVGK